MRGGTGLAPDSIAYVDHVTDLVLLSLQHGAHTSRHPAHSRVGWTLSSFYDQSLSYTQDPYMVA